MKLSRLTLFTIVNLILFFVFALAIYNDQNRQWKIYQKEFQRIQKLDKKYPVQIRQVILSGLNRVDRCISCHIVIDKKGFEDGIEPLRSHPGDYLLRHSIERFGCTVCHEGQGLATITKTAHGDVRHWDEPMLKGVYIQSSCGKCHEDTDIPGAEALEKGKRFFKELGCIGCHAVQGWGGNISVDLSEIADKPIEEFDFTNIEGERTVANWLYEHFKDPQRVTYARPDLDVPYASPMPNDNLSDEDARALTALMLSYTGELRKIPIDYHVRKKPEPPTTYLSKEDAGKEVYYKFGCGACHGKDGAKGIPNYNSIGGMTPVLTYVAEGFTVDELKDKIRKGVQPVDKEDPKGPVPPLWMQRWENRITEEELDNLVAYLMSLMPKEEEEKWSE